VLSVRPVLQRLLQHLPHHETILIAVSGGSDSLALMHLLFDQCGTTRNLQVATVDHNLRPEAANEAQAVAAHCKSLRLPHQILTWDHNTSSKKTSEAARLARYDLLISHATKIGATAIALGHTLNDQAETVLMRSIRTTPSSSTWGLSAMPAISTHNLSQSRQIQLLRPLLHEKREWLRAYLTTKNVQWIDDPSNQKLSSERVRARHALERGAPFPNMESLARLAVLSGKTRLWINTKSADFISQNAQLLESQLTLRFAPQASTAVLNNVFATLIQAVGGQRYRAKGDKFEDLVTAYLSQRNMRKAVGRTLVSVTRNGASFEPERRRAIISTPPPVSTFAGVNHGFPGPLERFRPQTDDTLHDAVRACFA